jgi:hypothetical protein
MNQIAPINDDGRVEVVQDVIFSGTPSQLVNLPTFIKGGDNDYVRSWGDNSSDVAVNALNPSWSGKDFSSFGLSAWALASSNPESLSESVH